MKKLLSTTILALFIFSACSQDAEESPTTQEPIPRTNSTKEVSVFDLQNEETTLSFTKSGIATAEQNINISPEIAGRVTSISVKVGDQVSKNQEIAKLGNSLSTQSIDIQANSAKEQLQLSEDSQKESIKAAELSIRSAELAVMNAESLFKTANTTLEETREGFDEQIANSQIEIDNAALSLDLAEETLDLAEDSLDDAEDQIRKLRKDLTQEDTPENAAIKAQIKELEQLENNLENQLESAELQVDLAQNRLEQSRIALSAVHEQQDVQVIQLNQSVQSAYNQYLAALKQYESTKAVAEMQKIAAESQTLQAETNQRSSQANQAKKSIKSPINGKITAVMIDEDNLINPGQTIIQVKSLDKLIVKSSITPEEREFINIGDTVQISTTDNTTTGTIVSISPSLNPISKRIDLEIESDSQLPAESLVEITFSANTTDKIFIPLNSVFPNSGKKFTKIVQENREVKVQEVTIGQIFNNFVEVTAGLTGNEKIIEVDGQFIDEKEKVRIKK